MPILSLLTIKKNEFENRIFGLDLVRCIAILMVLSEHTLAAFLNLKAFIPIYYFFGSYGVDLFFVLSGFLIGSILVKINEKEKKIQFTSIKSFWIRRWFRTLPNYFLVLFLFTILHTLQHITITPTQFIKYIFFLQNVKNYVPGYEISWSLTIEEWFYLSFPIVLLVVSYIFSSKKKAITLTCTLFIVTCLLMRIWLSSHYTIPWDTGFRKRTPLRLDGIAIGVLIAVLRFYKPIIFYNYRKLLALIGIFTLTLLSLKFYFSVIENSSGYGDFFMNTYFFSIWSISLALLLPYAYSIDIKPGIVKSVVTYISLISYSIYLLHAFIRDVMWSIWGRDNTNIGKGISLIISFLIVTFIVSHIAYNLFEKRVTNLREEFGKKKEIVPVL